MSEVYTDVNGRVLEVGDEVRYGDVDATVTGFSGLDADFDYDLNRYVGDPVKVFIEYQTQHQDGSFEMVEDQVHTMDETPAWDAYMGHPSRYCAEELEWLDPTRARVV